MKAILLSFAFTFLLLFEPRYAKYASLEPAPAFVRRLAGPAGGRPLFRSSRLDAQVVMLHLERHGRADMGELGEGVEHHGDAQIAHRHHRRLPDAEVLGVDQAEEGQDRARKRKRRGLL